MKTDNELVEMLKKHFDNVKEKVGANEMEISDQDPSEKLEHNSVEKVRDKQFELFLGKV